MTTEMNSLRTRWNFFFGHVSSHLPTKMGLYSISTVTNDASLMQLFVCNTFLAYNSFEWCPSIFGQLFTVELFPGLCLRLQCTKLQYYLGPYNASLLLHFQPESRHVHDIHSEKKLVKPSGFLSGKMWVFMVIPKWCYVGNGQTSRKCGSYKSWKYRFCL